MEMASLLLPQDVSQRAARGCAPRTPIAPLPIGKFAEQTASGRVDLINGIERLTSGQPTSGPKRRELSHGKSQRADAAAGNDDINQERQPEESAASRHLIDRPSEEDDPKRQDAREGAA